MNYDKNNYTITKVIEGKDWFDISSDSSCFGLKNKWGKTPKVGDNVTLYTKGFSLIVGMDLNGERCFLFSEEELEQHRQNWLKENEEKKQREFLESKDELDKRFLALPVIFQKRIERFRANNPRFRIDYEAYELFCCEQAVVIADACKTKEGIEDLKKLPYEEQVKKGLSDGHSGNTFGASCALAFFYLGNPDNIIKMNGALSPLVGSKEYGDIPQPTEAQ